MLPRNLFMITVSILLMGIIFELIRRKRLNEEYSLLWFLCGLIFLLLGFRESIIEKVSVILGIDDPPNALFFFAFLFLFLIVLHYSTVISKLTNRNTQLTQKVAILEWRLKGLIKVREGEKPSSVQHN